MAAPASLSTPPSLIASSVLRTTWARAVSPPTTATTTTMNPSTGAVRSLTPRLAATASPTGPISAEATTKPTTQPTVPTIWRSAPVRSPRHTPNAITTPRKMSRPATYAPSKSFTTA